MRDDSQADGVSRTGWLSLKQAALALGISESSIRRRVRAGQLVARQVPTDRGPAWRVLLRRESDDVEVAQGAVGLEEDQPGAPEMDVYIDGLERVPWRLLGYAASAWLIATAVCKVADTGRWWVYWLLGQATFEVMALMVWLP